MTPLLPIGLALAAGWYFITRSSSSSSGLGQGSKGEPFDFGVPFAAPTGRVWPVQGMPPSKRVVVYRSTKGGGSPISFGAPRPDAGTGSVAVPATYATGRRHAGIDLDAFPPQNVVAAEDGVVTAISHDYVTKFGGGGRMDGVFVRSPTVGLLYGEIVASPALKVGSAVKAGQVLGQVGLNDAGRSMLHFEAWQPNHLPSGFTPWVGKPPVGLLDPTKYLLALAQKP